MNAGELDKRITLQRQTETEVFGETRRSWIDAFRVWARVEAPTTRDVERAAAQGVEVQYRVTCRYREDITSRMRIMYDGRVLEIVGEPLDVEGTRETLRIYAASRGGDGC